MNPEKHAPEVFVGMGVTFYWAEQVYPGTVSRVSEDGRTVWFRQDVALPRRWGAAFLFIEDVDAPEFEASLVDGAYVMNIEWNRRPIELGIRRSITTCPEFLRRD